MNGGLIVVEGADGTGKSSLCENLVARLKSSREKVLLLAFPGNSSGTLGKKVYEIHRCPQEHGITEVDPTALQCLHIAAHLDAIASRILPAVRSGTLVVLDRYWWSTFVYGVVGGANREVISKLIDAEVSAWGDLKPATLILIDRETPLRDEPMPLWRRWRSEYLALAANEEADYPVHVVVNNTSKEDALDRIWRLLPDPI